MTDLDIRLSCKDIADLVKKSLIKQYGGKVLRNGWVVKDFEVIFSEKYVSGTEEWDEGWSYNEMDIYVVSERLCGKKQVLKKKKDRLYFS